jgi:quinol-cytochrome oxidoreductase complex cytochrome b subunit
MKGAGRKEDIPVESPDFDYDEHWAGPGAATMPELEAIEGGHVIEPEYKRMAIGPAHPLYPVLIGLALFPILMGGAGHHLADDLPEEETHPFFPDHFWPYPIIMVSMAVGVGLLSAFVQENLALEQSADPRAVVLPRPDWYFLFLFQFLKIPILPEWIMALVIPPGVVLALLLWPFIDAIIGPRLARRLGWARWPVPGRNIFTGTLWVLFLGFIFFMTMWAVLGFTLFGITGG